MSPLTNTTNRTAAVTGAGSGLGRDIALGLAATGYMVFGTAMSPAEVDELGHASEGTPQNSAPLVAPNIPRANSNGMF
jgi:NAD(P)-dependent dehydrogenase (short-subunit alcohol dehydrogenase family)